MSKCNNYRNNSDNKNNTIIMIVIIMIKIILVMIVIMRITIIKIIIITIVITTKIVIMVATIITIIIIRKIIKTVIEKIVEIYITCFKKIFFDHFFYYDNFFPLTFISFPVLLCGWSRRLRFPRIVFPTFCSI